MYLLNSTVQTLNETAINHSVKVLIQYDMAPDKVLDKIQYSF